MSETSRARQLVQLLAVEAGFSGDRCFDIQVASSEACANAIEHSPPESEVEFVVLAYPDRLEIQVEGRGEFELPAVAARERVHRGLGLPLMAKLSDHMSLYSGPRGGTLVALTFYRSGFRDEHAEDVTPPSIAALLKENEFVAAITDTAPVGLYVLDPELRFRWANPTYREFLEEPYRSQPLEGVFIGDAVPGSETMGPLGILQKVSRTGERALFPEYEFVGFGRGTTYWRWEIIPLAKERSELPYHVLVVISEITEQVEQRRRLGAIAAEAAARAAQLQSVLDASAVAIWVAHDPESRVITGNLYADEIIMGVKRGGNISRSAPPGTADASYTVWRDGRELRPDELPAQIAATTAQAVFDQEFELRFPDGRVVYMLANAVPVFDADGEVSGSVTAALDVTGRKQAEGALRHSQVALQKARDQLEDRVRERTGRLALANQELASAGIYARSLIEASLDPLLTIGPDGKITDVNEATVKITLYERNELIGTDFSDYFTDSDKAGEGYREVFAKGAVTDYPLTVRDRQGRLTDVLYNASVYKDQEGKVLGVFAAARDITALKLLEEQRAIAGRLQQALLDIPQQARGVRFGHLYRSATEQAQVGGDFYDVFEAKDGRIALLIGDVSGHGLEAARIATLVKDTVHAFVHQFRRPHLVLRETNRLLVEKKLPGFVTAFLGFLDPESGTFTYSSAGHPPPLRATDSQITLLQSIGSPLGVFADARYRDSETVIQVGSLLLLYTDGITEARRNGDLFGEERLAEALGRMGDRPVETLPSLLLEEALLFSGGLLGDDAALLAVNYLGETGGSKTGGREQA